MGKENDLRQKEIAFKRAGYEFCNLVQRSIVYESCGDWLDPASSTGKS